MDLGGFDERVNIEKVGDLVGCFKFSGLGDGED